MTNPLIRTQYPGVYSRAHKTRKHGVRLDQYFAITYRMDGKKKWEGIGWASEGVKACDVSDLLNMLKKNQRSGKSPRTLAESRELAKGKAEQREAEKELQEKESITFQQFWDTYYWPAQAHKAFKSRETEEGLLKKWIAPVIASKPLIEIAPFDLERLKSDMLKANLSPSTIKYAFAVVSQVWTLARRDGFIAHDSPTKRVNLPRIDNRRDRFLSPDEAQALLDELVTHSPQTHDIATIALYAGLRFGEVAGLTWRDVDIERGILTIRDPKARVNRQAFIVGPIKEVLERLKTNGDLGLIFIDRKGDRVKRISNIYRKAVDRLFNEGITDRRQKVTFHTLRHTFASWLVGEGTSLYHVKELLGHSDFKMTQRYSHLAPDGLREAAKRIETVGLRGNNG